MHDRRVAVCYGLVYILCTQVLSTNSRTSTLWKLNSEEGKIVSVGTGGANCKLQSSSGKAAGNIATAGEGEFDSHTHNADELSADSYQPEEDEESTFHIITTTAANYRDNTWRRHARDKIIVNLVKTSVDTASSANIKGTGTSVSSEQTDVLDCGKPVNFTYYDDLIGLYNQIGNFWRIKGDARHSIECFRGALAMSPTNAEVLLNLARVLFNLQYLDDAIHLTRRSLEVQPRDRSAWRQYFTLGEIFKAYGHFQESVNHLRQALELYPQYEPIKKAIADVENISASSLHIFTIIIIVFLVMCVLYVILSSNESNQNSHELEQKATRHFNRAMAMRSLKGFTQRSFKNRK
uniref:Uncharacterized protein n=1 Tax=Anopheles maculatus TaxID=74869 RepID=A0A182T7Y3_9DIPT